MTKIGITISLLVLVIGAGVYFYQPKFNGASDLNALISQVELDHKHVAPFIKNGITYEVNEYLTPKGDKGYWITMKREIDEEITTATSTATRKRTQIKSYSLNPYFNFDWR